MSRHRHHRHRKQSGDNSHADRAARYRAIVAELVEQSGLPASNLKLIAAAWTMLAQDGVRSQILAGEIIDVSDLERCAAILRDIMPSKPHELTVNFVESAWCPNCRSAFTPPPAEPEPADRAQQSVPPKALPAPPVAPSKAAATPPADAPTKPTAPAPKRSDTDIAPWCDISGTGRVQGQEPSWSAPSRYRCYGDIPEGF
jgi:hypothetical protein